MHDQSIPGRIQNVVDAVYEQVRKDVYGHEETVRLLIGGFLIGGHVLLEGPPGVAKTLTARTFASSLGLTFKRIQFTPDLMPSDVTGVTMFDQRSATFRFAPGPIFADIILADEINRTPPKTQASLLEAMEERFVTIDGERHSLDQLFFVIATQNPVEHEGTFPLPEAQLDRFLFKLRMEYPGAAFEEEMIRKLSGVVTDTSSTSAAEGSDRRQITREVLVETRSLIRQIHLDQSVSDYVQRIVAATREHADLALGASPRAALNLALASKLEAALQGREYVIPDDVQAMCKHVLSHRIIFQPEIFEIEEEADRLLEGILSNVSVPERVSA